MGAARPRVVFFGQRRTFSVKVLERLAERHEVVAVVESCQPWEIPASGWRRRLRPIKLVEDIERVARGRSLPFLRITPADIEPLLAFLKPLRADLGVIASMAMLLPERVIAALPGGLLNIHPSLLPKYRGPSPIFWAFFHGETTSGVTVHYVDRGEDTGDIVAQAEVPLHFGETAGAFEARYVPCAIDLIDATLTRLRQGPLERRSQAELPCPFRARYLRSLENPIPWETWPIERVYQAMRGADGFFDLVPPRPFLWDLLEWNVVGFDKEGGQPGGPVMVRTGARFHLTHPEGRVRLKPKLAPLWAWRHFRAHLTGALRKRPAPVPA